jgi:hypothetical protein
VADCRTISVATPAGGWPPPWPQVAEIEAVLPCEHWTLIGGLMVQLHAYANGLGPGRPTGDVDMIVHIETRRGRPGKVAAALHKLGYELRPSVDPRVKTAHRFVRNNEVVDVVAADHAAPRVREQLRGYDMVEIAGGTQALKRTINAELQIVDGRTTTVSVPDELAALILKAAAHRNDRRDSERHLVDAAYLLACIRDPFAPRTMSGSDRARLRHLYAQLSDPLNPIWQQVPEGVGANARVALDVLARNPQPRPVLRSPDPRPPTSNESRARRRQA